MYVGSTWKCSISFNEINRSSFTKKEFCLVQLYNHLDSIMNLQVSYTKYLVNEIGIYFLFYEMIMLIKYLQMEHLVKNGSRLNWGIPCFRNSNVSYNFVRKPDYCSTNSCPDMTMTLGQPWARYSKNCKKKIIEAWFAA